MTRTDVTYKQLDKTLRSLGFSCREENDDPPARVYEHEDTGAYITIPPFPETDFVVDYHLLAARTIVDLFGVTDPKVFDAQVRTAA